MTLSMRLGCRLFGVAALLLGITADLRAQATYSRVGYLEPDHKALAVKAVAAARARGGRVMVVRADGSGSHATIQNAVDAAKAGDLVLVHPGTYRERVEFGNEKNGTKGHPIVLKSADKGAVVDGEKKRNCIVIRGDFVVVDGIECRNAKLEAKHPNNGSISFLVSRGSVVRNCYVHDALQGKNKAADIALTEGHDYVISNNRLASKVFSAIDCGWKSTGGVVEYNECTGSYIGVYVHTMAHRTEVRYNYMHDMMQLSSTSREIWHGDGVWFRDNVGSSVHHNLIVGANAYGIRLYDFVYKSHGKGMPGYDQPKETHRVYNNTIIQAKLVGIAIDGAVENSVVKDNVVVGSARAALLARKTKPGNRFERNVYWDCAQGWDSGGAAGPPKNALAKADPRFADAARGDYRPSPGSPLIDAGDPAGPIPAGGGDRPDIGAYELLRETPRQPAKPGARRRRGPVIVLP